MDILIIECLKVKETDMEIERILFRCFGERPFHRLKADTAVAPGAWVVIGGGSSSCNTPHSSLAQRYMYFRETGNRMLSWAGTHQAHTTQAMA